MSAGNRFFADFGWFLNHSLRVHLIGFFCLRCSELFEKLARKYAFIQSCMQYKFVNSMQSINSKQNIHTYFGCYWTFERDFWVFSSSFFPFHIDDAQLNNQHTRYRRLIKWFWLVLLLLVEKSAVTAEDRFKYDFKMCFKCDYSVNVNHWMTHNPYIYIYVY